MASRSIASLRVCQRAAWRIRFVQPALFFRPCHGKRYSTKNKIFMLDLDLDSLNDEQDQQNLAPDTSVTAAKISKMNSVAANKQTPNREEVTTDTCSNDSLDKHWTLGKGDDQPQADKKSDQDKLDDILASINFSAAEEEPEVHQKPADTGSNDIFAELFEESMSVSKHAREHETAKAHTKNSAFQKKNIQSIPAKNAYGLSDESTQDGGGSRGPGKSWRRNKNVLEEEKDLFEKIFATYSKPEPESTTSTKLQQQILTNLQESFASATEGPSSSATRSSHQKLSEHEMSTIRRDSDEALEPTYKYISGLNSRAAVVDFARGIFLRFRESEFQKPTFFLHKLRGESADDYLSRQAEMAERIAAQSSADPSRPLLNIFTMPAIFNYILRELDAKYQDGMLTLSLFNMAKEDLGLYTVVCNQQTYNEMLRVHWAYFGKGSLCEIELIVVEMMNNGFSGDAVTYAIMKEILSTYRAMRMGRTTFNPGGLPIWSEEDERRAWNLSEKTKHLAKRLQREALLGAPQTKIQHQ